MEIQRIEEIEDNTPIFDHGTPKTNDSVAEVDFDDVMPANLVPSCEVEDRPEIFKRIRLLTRWDFQEESQGRLRYRTNENCWWRARCLEAQAMKRAVRVHIEHTMPEGLRQHSTSWDTGIAIGFYFVGKTVQQSRPVLLVFSMRKTSRKEIWKLLRGIGWLNAHPNLILLTTCNQIFHHSVQSSYAKFITKSK